MEIQLLIWRTELIYSVTRRWSIARRSVTPIIQSY